MPARSLTVPLKEIRQFMPLPPIVPGMPTEVTSLDGGITYIASVEDKPIGVLALRREIRSRLDRGWHIFAAPVAFYAPADGRRSPGISIHAFYSLGEPTAADRANAAAFDPDPPEQPAKRFTLGIVGESYRQDAVRRCAVGDAITFYHDSDNAHDPRAIAVFARAGQIGFLPRDGWLTRALLDERKQVRAEIATIGPGAGAQGHWGVVLEVDLEGPHG